MMSETRTTFEAYSYRTSSRFGGRVQVSVDGARVSVTGPRVGVLAYRLWIALQAVLLWLIPPALLAAAILSDTRYLVAALAMFVAQWGISGIGAGSLWGIADLTSYMAGKKGATSAFPLGEIKRVRPGRAWARKGLWFVIPHFIAVNVVTAGQLVSFEAPDGATGGDAVYAFVFPNRSEAAELAAALGAEDPAWELGAPRRPETTG